ncbi:MAG TPA: peptidoglycan DD-metalloendopeptidase family protein [Acidimicrobiia bacterium]
MRLHHPGREITLCLVLCLVAASFGLGRDSGGAGAAPPAAPGCAAWLPPVDGPVVRPFQAPAFAYGPGHRGVDLAAPPGTPVRAAGDGVVSFAGSVAGSLHVVVAHDGDLRTTYAFLAGTNVRTGERVARGQVVGVVGGSGPEHEPGALHFGLRLGDRYVDPQRLLAACDLTELVRLVPVDEVPAEPWDARRTPGGSLSSGGAAISAVAGDLAGALGDTLGGALDVAGSGWDAVSTAAGAVRDRVAGIAQFGAGIGRDLAGWGRAAFERSQYGLFSSVVADVASGFADWWRHRQGCSDGSPAADGSGGSGHLLMAVGGIDSSGGPADPTFPLDTRALGYRHDEVVYFSYAPDGGAYRASHTRGDLHAAGFRLSEQLKRSQREHPGREVDLIAYSQGGVVVDVLLQDYYDAGNPEYPPIGTVVTLSSPHQGAPLATSAADWRASPVGLKVVDAAEKRLPVPPASAPSVRQLDEDSSFLRELWAHRLPEHVDFTTIGATDDVLVPATQVDVPDASKVVVNVGGGPLDDHTNIPRDPNALRVVRSALEGRPPPCIGAVEGLRGVVVPTLITRVEHGLGDIPVVSR